MISCKKFSLRIGWLSLLLAAAMILTAGCGQTAGGDQPDRSQDEITNNATPENGGQRLVYLCEDLSLQKYQGISAGIRQRCDDYGITCTVVDAKGNAGVLMDYMESLDADSTDGLLVSALTEPLGPLIQSRCDEAGIPAYTISSRMRDKEGQDLPGIEISAYESGEAVAESISGAIRNGAFEMESPFSVIMCSMSNMTPAKEVMMGFYDTFSVLFPHLSSDSYMELEVLSPYGEGHYFSLTNFFGKIDPAMQYVIVTFNDDGSMGILDFVQEAGIRPEKLLFGSVGMQENARMIYEGDPVMAERYHVISGNYEKMGQQAVDRMYAHLEQGSALPQVFMSLGEIVTAETYRPLEAVITS